MGSAKKTGKTKLKQPRVPDPGSFEKPKDSSVGSDASQSKDEAPEPLTAATAASKSRIVRFGDDDEESSHQVAPQKEAVQDKEETGGDEDSDDEAPEAVSTSKAASDLKKAAQAAQKAAKEQAAAQKRKRQQRDERFKQQAERKKAEEEAAAAAAATTPKDGSAVGRRRTDRAQVPAVLPAEFLTDSSDESSQDEDAGVTVKSRPKRRKVSTVENRLTRLDRGGASDERVGSTVYRVVKKVDEKLAPRSNKYSQRSKELLLRRNRTAVKPESGFRR